jgi:hypothetical protein
LEGFVARIKQWFSARVGAYGELASYLRDIRKVGLEIAYGESLLALAFAIYTYVYAISLCSVLAFLGGSCLLAGYHIWRVNHLRLLPKLEFSTDIFVQEVRQNSGELVRWIQVLPRCLTASPVDECVGRLLRVRMPDNGGATALFNEPLDLSWSTKDSRPLTLYPDVDQRLNVVWTSSRVGYVAAVDLPKLEDRFVFNSDGPLRFDIMVISRYCPPVTISVDVTIERVENGAPKVKARLRRGDVELNTNVHYENLLRSN